MECLENDEICTKKLCKDCKLKDCKETIKMLDRLEAKEYNTKVNKIKAQLPRMCKNCNLLEILNLDKQKLYCPYRIKERCILK